MRSLTSFQIRTIMEKNAEKNEYNNEKNEQ
jgi:hypothetical protein